MKKFYWMLGLILVAGIFVCGCLRNKEQITVDTYQTGSESFVIAGSGTNLPITGRLVEAFNRQTEINVQMPASLGSGGGIRAVTEGVIDIGLSSRPLKEDEKVPGLKVIPYARVGIVVGANEDVPDHGITYQELTDIFRGNKTTWQNGRMIIVQSREEGDSSNLVLGKEVPGFQAALADSLKYRKWQVNFTDAEEARAIADISSSIGFTDTGSLAVSGLRIKPLQVNGITPTTDNIKAGQYKLYKDLYFVVKAPATNRVEGFLDFVFSAAGEKIITANGGIPLKSR